MCEVKVHKKTSSLRARPRESGEQGVAIQEQQTNSLKKFLKLITRLPRPALCRARNDGGELLRTVMNLFRDLTHFSLNIIVGK